MRYVPPAPPAAPIAQPAAVWLGEPIEKYKITLRVFGGEGFDPEYLTKVLGCRPTMAEIKGQRIVTPTGTRTAQENRWSLTVESDHRDEIEQGITSLLNRLPTNLELWRELTQRYNVDLYCGLFLRTSKRGFGLSPQVTRMLADRNVGIGFDLYFDRA
jgi:Domain of unknown function (DUF4279)